MRLKEISPEVFAADMPIVRLSRSEIEFLKERVKTTPRGRIRLCAHPDNEDPLHEMFIVLSAQTYIRPHKHFNKSESFHILEGTADVILFDDDGGILDVIELGDLASGREFFYRLGRACYHTLIIHSDLLVVHEITNGPFKQDAAQFAPWSPEENNPLTARNFIDSVAARAQEFLARNRCS